MRPPVRILVPAVVALLAFAGCGSDDETTSVAEAATDVTLRLDVDGPGGAEPQEATLTCPGGDEAGCSAIAALPADPAAETPANQACTQVYGGPETLSVNGVLGGEEVAAVFTRENGCEIERFERFADVLTAVFPDYGGGTSAEAN